MKTLLLMKHAESGWNKKTEDDWYRPLNAHGEMDALQIGEMILAKNLVPDLILSSSAVRAHQTAGILANQFEHRSILKCLDSLYLAEMEVYFQEIQQVPDKVNNLLVVGHSPALNRILQVITERIEYLSFSTTAYVTVPIDSWKNFKYDVQGELAGLLRVNPTLSAAKDYRGVGRFASSRLQ